MSWGDELRPSRAPRPVRRAAGATPAVARRVRPAARPGRASSPGSGLDGAVRSLTRPASRRLDRPRPARRPRPAAGAARRLGPRPPVVAGPHGPHRGAARRAHDARLARLVRDLQGRRPTQTLMLRQNAAAAPPRARVLRGPRARRSPGTRRCCCGSTARRTTAVVAERELRARAAGAVLPRRRPRLRRARRPRDRPRADRLPQRLERRRGRRASATTSRSTTPGAKRIYGQARALRLAGRRAPGRPPPLPSRVPRRASCGATSSRRRRRPPRRARSSACTCVTTARCARWSRRSCAIPHLYDAGPADGQAAGRPGRRACCAPLGRGIDTDRVGVDVRRCAGQLPLRAAQRLGLGRHALAGHRDLPRPLADGHADLRARARWTPKDEPDVPVRARRAGVAGALRFWAPRR